MQITGFPLNLSRHNNVHETKQEKPAINNENRTQVISANGAKALKAMYPLAFKSELEAPYDIDNLHNIVKNLFDFTKARIFKISARPELDIPELFVTQTREPNGITKVTINDSEGREVLSTEKQIGHCSPIVMFSIGKSGITATLTDNPKRPGFLKGVSIIMRPDSDMNKPFFKIRLPQNQKAVSFGAFITAIEAFQPERSQEGLRTYFGNNRYYDVFGPALEDLDAIKGRYFDEVRKIRKQVNVVLTIGGFGDRSKPLTRINHANKPSLADWTTPDHRLADFTLDNLIRCGLMDPEEIRFDRDICHYVEGDPRVSTAGGVVEAIHNKALSTDKPVIICPGDGISDLDYSLAVHKFMNTDDAGIMLIGYPVPKEKTRDLGIIAFDEQTMHIQDFREKKDPLPGASLHLANIALYMFKPEALERLREIYFEKLARDNGAEIAEQIKNGDVHWSESITEFDFGKHAIPQLLRECKEGRLIGKNGKPLRMYVEPTAGTWEDVGKIDDYASAAYKTAWVPDAFKNLPPRLKEAAKLSVNPETKVICIPAKDDPSRTEQAFIEFLGESGSARGNIIVMPHSSKS